MAKSSDSTNSEGKKAIDFIVREFKKYDKFHEARFANARDIIKMWHGELTKVLGEDWQNQVHVPLMFEGEQTITPRIFTALFPTDAPLDIKTEGDTPREDGIVIKGLIQHFFRVSDVRAKSSPMLTQNTLLGTAYAEAGSWLVKRGFVDFNGSKLNLIVDNRPDFNPVDFFEMFPHPQKKSMGDGLPLIRRRWIDEEALKRIAENPFFKFDNLKEALESEPDEKREDVGSEEPTRKEYEILDYWGPWDKRYVRNIDGEEKEFVEKAVPHWIIIVNRKIRVRMIPNPFNHQMPPFIKTILFPDVTQAKGGAWFGVGIGQVGKPSQERINKIVNQRLNNVDLILNKQGAFNGNDPLLDKRKLQTSKPGKWIKCSDVNTSLKWIDTPDVTASSYKEEEIAKNDFRESVGATSTLQPTEDATQHRTAQGIQLLQGAAGMRFRPVLIQLEQDFVAQVSNFYFSNAKQFMVLSEWVEIMGEGASRMVRVTPDQIQRRVRFIPTGISETVNKEIQIGQLLRFKEITVNDPTINRSELNKRIAELFGFKDIDKIIIPESQRSPSGSGLSPEQENLIRQRLAEGASAEQIKMEMLGPAPELPSPQELSEVA